MSDTKFCKNHPSAKAVASCHLCTMDLCGMCGNFIDNIVLCDRCSEIHETEQYVAAQSEKLERPETTMVVDGPEPPATRSKTGSRSIQWAVIAACFAIITAQLYFYNSPVQVQQDPAAIARDRQLDALVRCMLVFREIGLTLADGRMPSNALRCADSAAANIQGNEDGVMRFYHPNPQFYGYREISVAADAPEPRLVRAVQ